jgi:DNA-binding MarR family transcriptional regulator
MAALHHRSEQRVGELAELTSIEVSTLSRLLGTMERKNLVERRRSAADARTVLVRLTEVGAGITHLIIPRALHYEAVALESFSPVEAEALWAMLVRLFHNIDKLDAEADARLPRSARGAIRTISCRKAIFALTEFDIGLERFTVWVDRKGFRFG